MFSIYFNESAASTLTELKKYVVQKKSGGEKQRRWVLWKTSVEDNITKNLYAREYQDIQEVKGKPKLAELMKKVDKYLQSNNSTKHRQLSIENAAALRIQTAFRAFLVNILPFCVQVLKSSLHRGNNFHLASPRGNDSLI